MINTENKSIAFDYTEVIILMEQLNDFREWAKSHSGMTKQRIAEICIFYLANEIALGVNRNDVISMIDENAKAFAKKLSELAN